MRRDAVLAVLASALLSVAAAACAAPAPSPSPSNTKTKTETSSAQGDTKGNGSSTTPTNPPPSSSASSPATPASTAGKLVAPNLVSVMKMQGGIHLTWTGSDSCDAVEGEQKMVDMGDYSVAFTVPGTTKEEMDTTATEDDMTYEYRLRCKKGSQYSPYSNEMSPAQ